MLTRQLVNKRTLYLCESLVEVGDDVVNVFDTNAQANG